MTSSQKPHILAITTEHLAAELQAEGHQLPQGSEGCLFVISENRAVWSKMGNLIHAMLNEAVNPHQIDFPSNPMSFDCIEAREIPALMKAFDVTTVSSLAEATRTFMKHVAVIGRAGRAAADHTTGAHA